jgi:hypothetical protein
MTTPDRTKEGLIKQAENMLIRVYEQVNWTNLYGYVPRNYNSQDYQKAVRKCMTICRKYKDTELLNTYKEYFELWKKKSK